MSVQITKTIDNSQSYGTTNIGSLNLTGSMITQGLVYEQLNQANQTSINAPIMNFGIGGVFTLGTTITANAALYVTNFPTDTSKAYTFSVVYYQPSTRFYINQIQIQNTTGGYITNSGVAGVITPLYNGGTPSLSGTTVCVITQQFTVINVGGAIRVFTSISCCS